MDSSPERNTIAANEGVSMTTDRETMTTEHNEQPTSSSVHTTSNVEDVHAYVTSSESTIDGDIGIFRGQNYKNRIRSNNQIGTTNVARRNENLDEKRKPNKAKQNSLK